MDTVNNKKTITADALHARIDWTKTDYRFVEDCLKNTSMLFEETEDTPTLLYFAMTALGKFTKGTPAVDDFTKLYESQGSTECAKRVRTSSYREEDLAFYWSTTESICNFFENSCATPTKSYQSADLKRSMTKEIMSDIWEHEPFHEIDKVPEALNTRSWNLYHLEDITIIYDTAEFAVLDKSGRPVLDLCSANYQHVYFTKMFERCTDYFSTATAKDGDIHTLDNAVMIQDLIRAPNYCHWLLDQLPRTRHLHDNQTLIMYKLAPFMQAMLESMSIDSSRVFELQERAVIRVRKLTIESSMAKHFYHPCQDVNTELVEYIRNALPDRNARIALDLTHPYIYLSRNKSDRRRISNEQGMLDCLDKYGFKTIYPEELSLQEQIAVFGNAKVIVSPHGASLANLVFCKDVNIIEIFNQNYGTPTFYLIASILGFQYQHILGENPLLSTAEKQRIGNGQLQKEDIAVDIKRLDQCLETIFKKNSLTMRAA